MRHGAKKGSKPESSTLSSWWRGNQEEDGLHLNLPFPFYHTIKYVISKKKEKKERIYLQLWNFVLIVRAAKNPQPSLTCILNWALRSRSVCHFAPTAPPSPIHFSFCQASISGLSLPSVKLVWHLLAASRPSCISSRAAIACTIAERYNGKVLL